MITIRNVRIRIPKGHQGNTTVGANAPAWMRPVYEVVWKKFWNSHKRPITGRSVSIITPKGKEFGVTEARNWRHAMSQARLASRHILFQGKPNLAFDIAFPTEDSFRAVFEICQRELGSGQPDKADYDDADALTIAKRDIEAKKAAEEEERRRDELMGRPDRYETEEIPGIGRERACDLHDRLMIQSVEDMLYHKASEIAQQIKGISPVTAEAYQRFAWAWVQNEGREIDHDRLQFDPSSID